MTRSVPTKPQVGILATTVFLLTDIEGSTRLWERFPLAMRAAIRRHDHHGEVSARSHNGLLLKERGEGDSLFMVFSTPLDAVIASLDFLQRLSLEPWPEEAPFKVRMAVHLGEAEFTGSDYYGSCVNRCARLRALGHGGQILVSAAVATQVAEKLPPGSFMRDLGLQALKDLMEPEQVFQIAWTEYPNDFPPLKGLSSTPNNLPHFTTPFIGRVDDIKQLKSLLSQSRLVTVLGPGGCGKTRLAMQVAAEVLESYEDGIFRVQLENVTDQAVAASVLEALGAEEAGGSSIEAILKLRLRSKKVCLLFDNCEHVLDTVAPLIEDLLTACPGLKVMATSRTPLELPGETQFRLGTMSCPADATFAAAAASDSGQMFLDVARRRTPGFKIELADGPVLAAILAGLDGLPLAIELAAARTSDLTLHQIYDQLEQRFELLSRGYRTAAKRSQTIESMLDWSAGLLPDRARDLFYDLAVFRPGWTAADGYAVCKRGSESYDQFTHQLKILVDASLIYCLTDSARFGALQSMCEYGAQRLAGQNRADHLLESHYDHYASWARTQDEALVGKDQDSALEELRLAEANLRVALGRFVTQAPRNLILATTLWRYWFVRAKLSEGRAWLENALSNASGAPHDLVARAHTCLANLAWKQGDFVAAEHSAEMALVVARQANDVRAEASALSALGSIQMDALKLSDAVPTLQAALKSRREIGIPRDIGVTLNNLGLLFWRLNNLAEAEECLQEAIHIRQELGDDFGLALSLNNRGLVLSRLGRHEEARELHYAARLTFQHKHDLASSAHALLAIGDTYYHSGDLLNARINYQEAYEEFRKAEEYWGLAAAELSLGDIDLRESDLPAASRHFLRVLETALELNHSSHIAHACLALAHIAGQGRHTGSYVDTMLGGYCYFRVVADLPTEHHFPDALMELAGLAAANEYGDYPSHAKLLDAAGAISENQGASVL
ncbi:MAG: tetratricopeptide repeat protein [Fimbriimonadaceae bacterium]|nr:tetratricopeptide repeat protein [Fimbriimonadaceae bacterium]